VHGFACAGCWCELDSGFSIQLGLHEHVRKFNFCSSFPYRIM
jgi:hypothetical protein